VVQFTGSPDVVCALKSLKKPVILELGSYEACVVENVANDVKINADEAFGSESIMASFNDFDTALKEVNNSQFVLQAGIFTRDICKAHQAWDELYLGGVAIGDVPSWRVDNVPYGGVKESGLGREGCKFAMEDMKE
jgi:acyl-CoA reductase-like NAD-dependent aldehyde dehydrogenase